MWSLEVSFLTCSNLLLGSEEQKRHLVLGLRENFVAQSCGNAFQCELEGCLVPFLIPCVVQFRSLGMSASNIMFREVVCLIMTLTFKPIQNGCLKDVNRSEQYLVIGASGYSVKKSVVHL